MPDETKVFNTRLKEETITNLKVYAWYRQASIQQLTQKIMDDYFEQIEKDLQAAIKAKKKEKEIKGNPL